MPYPYSFLICVMALAALVSRIARASFDFLFPGSLLPVFSTNSSVSAWLVGERSLSVVFSFELAVLILAFSFILFLLFRVVKLGLLLDTRRFFLQNKIVDLFVLVTLAVVFSVLIVTADNFLFLFLV